MTFFAVPRAALVQVCGAGQQIWHDKAECNFCDGWAAMAASGPPTSIDGGAYGLHQRLTLQLPCSPFAYTGKRCYGMTAKDLGSNMPQSASTTLQADEL
jgi:hypothetical protein